MLFRTSFYVAKSNCDILTIGQMKDIRSGHEIEIIEKKTKKKRRITLNDEATTAIQKLLADLEGKYKDTDNLFQGQRGPLP